MTRLIIPLLVLILSGCSTFNERELAYLQTSGVSRPVFAKLKEGDPLSPPEIISAARGAVPDRYIIRHLRDHGVDYVVNRSDIVLMRRGGVSAAAIDELLRQSEDFASRYAEPVLY